MTYAIFCFNIVDSSYYSADLLEKGKPSLRVQCFNAVKAIFYKTYIHNQKDPELFYN